MPQLTCITDRRTDRHTDEIPTLMTIADVHAVYARQEINIIITGSAVALHCCKA